MADDFYDLNENEEEKLSLFQRIKQRLFGPAKKKDDGLYNEELGEFTPDEDPLSDDFAEEETTVAEKKKYSWHPFGFVWWEWLIIIVEVVLVTYTVLAFLNIVPLF